MAMVKFGKLEVGKEPILLCSVVEKTVEDTLAQAKVADWHGADAIELRLDKLENKSMIKGVIEAVREHTNIPLLAVCRPRHLYGFFEGPEEERATWLLEALKHQPDAVDIEYDGLFSNTKDYKIVLNEAKKNGITTLICYENFERTQSKETLLKILKEEENFGADIAKIAVMACNHEDTGRVLQVAEEAKSILNIPYVIIAMGKFGSISRPYALVLGASMTYCAPIKGKEGAPGQLPVRETRELYELLKRNLKTN